MNIAIKRVYEAPARSDGARILVDRLWPRGISKDSAGLTEWLRDLAPSNELRKWFHARPTQWLAFRKRYLLELREPEASSALEQLYKIASLRRKVTLLFGSRNLERNNATVLKELLEGMRKPPSSSGPLRGIAAGRASARGRR
jgi:uncharacterized protein YeaO (DUF488 family)